MSSTKNQTQTGSYKESKKLKFAHWFITHKEKIKKGIVIILIVLDVILVVFFIIGLTTYLLEYKREQTLLEGMYSNLVDYESWHKKNQPLPLEIINQTVIASGRDKYDFVALVENPNEKWAVSPLKYRFVWSDGETESETNFLLPREKKYLLILNNDVKSLPKDVQLEFQDIYWKRIIPRLNLPDVSKNDFNISEIKFIPKGAIALNKVKFKAENNSPFNFWTVYFNIILYQGTRIVGANRTFFKEFLAGEIKNLETSWSENLPSVTNIVIEPEIDLFDPDLIKPLSGTGEPK